MRRAGLVLAICLAVLLVILLLGERTFFRGGRGAGGEEGRRELPARAARDVNGGDATTAEDPADGVDAAPARDRAAPETPVSGRLVYLDDTPAVGVTIHLAVGRGVDVRVFRNGEFTDQTVFLVTQHSLTTTDGDGVFRFRVERSPTRARTFVYTAQDPQAFAVEEIRTTGQVVRARRRVPVKGTLLDRAGDPLKDYWFEGRYGLPEDWQTRVTREEDVFVAAAGDLHVDRLARDDARTAGDGSFSLRLVEGRNTLVFGEIRAEGSLDVEVAAPTTDVGALRVPGAVLADEERSLSGQVLSLAGTPYPGCEVRAWDGSVGMHTHAVETDASGQFVIPELRSHNVVLWAVPTERRHIDLPVQTSATIRMPCPSSITLHAPTEREYAWARVDAQGYYFFVRKGVFAAGDALAATDVVGLPPGPLHIHLVTDRIREAALEVREPGDLLLAASLFRDTTWD
ncbi:MAG TPA: hypothetical protein VFY93_00295 [Planctomycetota bacterium]|nr:hypothetical protein [Planctomycetota bacterium]